MAVQKAKTKLRSEVQSLLVQTVINEVHQEVQGKFERALTLLNGESLVVFREYLSGATMTTIATRHGLSVHAVYTWILKIRRDLIEQLRQECKVRQ